MTWLIQSEHGLKHKFLTGKIEPGDVTSVEMGTKTNIIEIRLEAIYYCLYPNKRVIEIPDWVSFNT